MDEKLIQKVLTQDPREKRRKSDEEVRQEWREKTRTSFFFLVPMLFAVAYLLYWNFFRKPEDFVLARRLPVLVRWAIGVMVGGLFGWVGYMVFSYRCPRCGNATAFRRYCLLCRAPLD